jgi:hypothetical protein
MNEKLSACNPCEDKEGLLNAMRRVNLLNSAGSKKQERSYRADRNVPVFVKVAAKLRRNRESGK